MCSTHQMFLVQQMIRRLLCLHQCMFFFFFLMLFTFSQTFHSYVMNSHTRGRSTLVFCYPPLRAVFGHAIVQGCWKECWFLAAFLLKAKFQSQSWLWASEKSVHEGHGGSAVSPEPAHQNTQEVWGGCKRGWLLPVSISPARCCGTSFLFLIANEGLLIINQF